YSVTGSGYEHKGLFLNEKKEAAPEELELLLKAGLLCNDAAFESGAEVKVIGDPSEAALLISAAKAGLNRHKLEQNFPRVDEISFTSERKMMTTLHRVNKNLVSYSKGAPDIIIDLCNRIFVDGKVYRLDAKKKKEILEYNELFASKALRVFGFAYRPETIRKDDAEKDMIFIGLQAMIDPPRQEVKDAIQKCKDAGIRVMMVTGDHLSTAKAIAEQLNITGKAITGKEIDALPNIDREIERINIFARVNPEHKLRIVNLLMQKGYVVAVTGDGINDAPALKKADIGVAMGITGTDVAKEASDLILTDDNFTSIVNAVEEGRGIYDNIGKFVKYLLSSNLAEILVIFLGMAILAPLAGLGLPLSPIHLLWINVVTDGLPAVALSMDPYAKDIMKRKPRDPKEHIITKKMAFNIIALGTIMALASLTLFWLYRDSLKAQTMVFTGLVVFELVRLYLVRLQNHTPLFSNSLLILSVILSLGSQIAIMYVPFLRDIFNVVQLEFLDWAWIFSAAAVMLVVTAVINRLQKPSSTDKQK
ncbi:MAG: cation-translocating P-type ATPase, partial [Nanoarchaeota archaeon]